MFKDFVINTLCTIPMMVVLAYSITFMVSFKHKWVYVLAFGVGTSLLRILLEGVGWGEQTTSYSLRWYLYSLS